MATDAYKYSTRTNGEVVIFHHGKLAKMLRDEPAQVFLKAIKDAKGADAQAVMESTAGNDGQMARPTSGTGTSGKAVHGDGVAHAPKEFRRKSGAA